jgi:hypothetical protein
VLLIPVFFIEQSIAFKTSKKVGKQKEIFFHHLLKKMAKYQNGNTKNGKTAKGNIHLKNGYHDISFKMARLSQHFIFSVSCDWPNKLDCSQHSDTQLTTHTHTHTFATLSINDTYHNIILGIVILNVNMLGVVKLGIVMLMLS